MVEERLPRTVPLVERGMMVLLLRISKAFVRNFDTAIATEFAEEQRLQ